jgi:hypothetical protein
LQQLTSYLKTHTIGWAGQARPIVHIW